MNNPHRVLFLDLSARFGGASSRVLGLLSAWPSGQAGLAGLHGSPVVQEARYRGLEVYELGGHKADPRLAARLSVVLKLAEFKIVDVQNSQSKWWSLPARLLRRTCLVSTLNSWYEQEHQGGWKGRIYQKLELGTRGITDLFIVVSGEIQERLLTRGVPEDAVAMIPNAVGLDPVTVPGSRDWLCREYGLPSASKIGCTVGRMVIAKGHDVLIQAMAMANDSDLYMIIVGDGPLRSNLLEEINKKGLADRVRLPGYLPPKLTHQIVKNADFFLLPSLTEGTPVALLEAAALGRPIIASQVGGIPEVVRSGEHAWLVPPGDAFQLAEAIKHLLHHPNEAMQLADQAREHVRTFYHVSRQVIATQQAHVRAMQRYSR